MTAVIPSPLFDLAERLRKVERQVNAWDDRDAALCEIDEARDLLDDLLRPRDVTDCHVMHPFPSKPLPDMVKFSELKPGQSIEHQHDWWLIVLIRSDGSMLLRREGDNHREWISDCHPDDEWNRSEPF